jgi:hypothetical protein
MRNVLLNPIALGAFGIMMGIGTANAQTGDAATWIRITAFTEVPLSWATVTVTDTSGRTLFYKERATNNRGVYAANISNLPGNFRVTLTCDSNCESDQLSASERASLGVFTLSADVRNFDPTYGMVAIDPATTLVSKLLDQNSQLTLDQAQTEVRSFLEMPADASLGSALRDDTYFHSPFFSEPMFERQAARHGGMDLWEDDLVDKIVENPAAEHPFLPRQEAAPPILKFIAQNLAGAALNWAAGTGIGWVMQAAGLSTPGATQEDIQNMQRSLADLQSSVDALSKQQQALTAQVLAKLTQTQYNQIVVPALKLAVQINGVESNLAFYAQGCPPLPENSVAPPDADFADFCKDQKITIAAQLNDVQINHSFDILSAWVLDNPTVGFKGLPHLFSQALGETVSFFRPADSTKIQNMFDYWDGVQLQGANLKVELLHLNGAQDNPGGIAQLQSFLGNSQAQPPTNGVLQNTRDAELKLIFPAVPANTVINTKDRTMWPTNYPDPEKPCGFVSSPPRGNASLFPAQSLSLNGFSWRSPSSVEVQALISGKTGSSPIAWLVDQTKAVAPDFPLSAGFPDVSKFPASCLNGKMWAWTNTMRGTVTFPGIGILKVYDVFRLDTGELGVVRHVSWSGVADSLNWIYPIRQLSPGEQYYWYP